MTHQAEIEARRIISAVQQDEEVRDLLAEIGYGEEKIGRLEKLLEGDGKPDEGRGSPESVSQASGSEWERASEAYQKLRRISSETFKNDPDAQEHLARTLKLSEQTADGFDAIFFPGGHGPLWDLAEDADSKRLVEAFSAADRPVAAVCHAPAVFRHVKGKDGNPLVSGRRVTGFTNSEEEAVGLTDVVPFRVEDMLKDNGGKYEKGEDWASFVLRDGRLVTGQNPASSAEAAEQIVAMLK